MVTLTFTWSWWAFAMGALSLLVLELLIIVWAAVVQYSKANTAKKDMWSDLEDYVTKTKNKIQRL